MSSPEQAPVSPPMNITTPISLLGKPRASAASPTGYGLWVSIRLYPAFRAAQVAATRLSASGNSARKPYGFGSASSPCPWWAGVVVGRVVLTGRSP